tara:strand:- start:484 stop:810 length:327 start_codon:yes stop_codon:yes gene_type:complete
VDVLKKIKAASLAETLVASVIVMIVFIIASLSVNNVFGTMVQSDDFKLQNRIRELQYLAKHNQLDIPFYETTTRWDIAIEHEGNLLVINTVHLPSENTKKTILSNETN